MNVQQEKWLGQALDQVSSVNRSEVGEYLRSFRCNSKSRKTFWVWLRIQLSKNGHHQYLKHISELRLPPEAVKPHQREGFQYAISSNRQVALIEVISGEDRAVWRVPVTKLDWALAMYPVTLKRLADLEPPEVATLRRLKRQLRTRQPFMTPKQRQKFDQDIADLEAIEIRSREYRPAPRYMIVKNADGQERFVHRLFLEAGPHDEVEAVDGDFTNYATTSYTRTEEPIATDGFVVVHSHRPPSVWSNQVTVPNLRVTNSGVKQVKFDKSHLQAKPLLHNDVETNEPYTTPPRVMPNATWLVDAGKHRPLSDAEKIAQGMRLEPPTRADRKKVIARRKAALVEPAE